MALSFWAEIVYNVLEYACEVQSMDFEENRPAQDVPLEENIEQTQDEGTAQETQQNEAARREKQYET